MFCMKCQNDIYACTCPDIEERLDKLVKSKHLYIATCPKCGRHVDRCICVEEGAARQ